MINKPKKIKTDWRSMSATDNTPQKKPTTLYMLSANYSLKIYALLRTDR